MAAAAAPGFATSYHGRLAEASRAAASRPARPAAIRRVSPRTAGPGALSRTGEVNGSLPFGASRTRARAPPGLVADEEDSRHTASGRGPSGSRRGVSEPGPGRHSKPLSRSPPGPPGLPGSPGLPAQDRRSSPAEPPARGPGPSGPPPGQPGTGESPPGEPGTGESPPGATPPGEPAAGSRGEPRPSASRSGQAGRASAPGGPLRVSPCARSERQAMLPRDSGRFVRSALAEGPNACRGRSAAVPNR